MRRFWAQISVNLLTYIFYIALQSTTSSTHDTLFNNAVSTSHSWPASSDSSGVTWDVDTPSVNNSTVPAVPTSDSRQKAPENTAHFKPER